MRALQEVRRGLLEAFAAVETYFGRLSIEDLHRRRPGEWAPIDDLAHLNLTVGLTARSLGLPADELIRRFGSTDRPSRTYEAVKVAYLETLRAGFRSPERFVPAEVGTDTDGERRARTLEAWRGVGAELQRVLDGWDEAGLDRFILPHPALGDLTVREMLFFTHIHALHHVEVAKRRLAADASTEPPRPSSATPT